eukprot:gene5930-5999_t
MTMQFRRPYLLAMREQAPGLYSNLQHAGRLEGHLDWVCDRARLMKAHILSDEPRSEGGWITDMQAERIAEEIVFAKLIQFPQPDWDARLEPAPMVADAALTALTTAEEDPDCRGCQVRSAVQRFAGARFEKLATSIVAEIAGLPACGIFEELGHEFQTVWDEFCYEVQNGPHDAWGYGVLHHEEYLMEAAFDPTITPFITFAVDNIAEPEAVLLSVGAQRYQDFDEHGGDSAVLDRPLICKAIRHSIDELASNRDLSEFDELYYANAEDEDEGA